MPKRLYISHCTDRHIDDVIRVFDKVADANAHARAFMAFYSARGKRVDEWEEGDGPLYDASCEAAEAYARVLAVTLNDNSQEH